MRLFLVGLLLSVLGSVVLSIVPADLATSSPMDGQPPNFRLTYFDAKGAAEVSRLLMKIGNVDFIDHRLPIPTTAIHLDGDSEYETLKRGSSFSVNMDRLPVLDIDEDLTIGQSRAIERYVAEKCKLFGGNDEERAMIDCISENVRDIKEKYAGIRRSAIKASTSSDLTVFSWFQNDDGLLDWLTRLERSLPPGSSSSDFAVGNTLSLADVSIWHLLRDYFHGHLPEARKAEDKALCVRLSRIAQKVSEHSAVKKWLADRPPSPF